jgi:hypothetical protein
MENLLETAAQALVKFKVVKPFTLTHDDHTKEHFVPGDYERPAHIALHWFVQAHTDKPPADALAIGSPQHAVAMRALVNKRRQLLEEAEAAYHAALEEGQKVFGYSEAVAVTTQAAPAPPVDPAGDAALAAQQAEADAAAAAKAEADAAALASQQDEGEGTGEDGQQNGGADGAGIVARRKAPPQE